MGKLAPDATLDRMLDFIATGNYYCVCSGSPTTYAQAYTDNVLAKVEVSSGSYFVKADDTSGRKLTMGAVNGVSITGNGFAEAVAIVSSASSALLYVTTCTGQSLVSGGTVDIPAWKINIQDPT